MRVAAELQNATPLPLPKKPWGFVMKSGSTADPDLSISELVIYSNTASDGAVTFRYLALPGRLRHSAPRC